MTVLSQSDPFIPTFLCVCSILGATYQRKHDTCPYETGLLFLSLMVSSYNCFIAEDGISFFLWLISIS